MPSCGDLDAGYRVADFNADGLLDVLVLGKVHAPGGPHEFARVFSPFQRIRSSSP